MSFWIQILIVSKEAPGPRARLSVKAELTSLVEGKFRDAEVSVSFLGASELLDLTLNVNLWRTPR